MCNWLNRGNRKKLSAFIFWVVGEISVILVESAFAVETRQPCPYMQLSTRGIPDPGENSFVYYASDYYQHEIFASPDLPTMIAFGQNSRLPKDKPSPEIRLILDLPEGFQIYGGRFISKPIESSAVKKEGKDYRRFRINCWYEKDKSRSGVTELIVSTNLKAVQSLKAYYATEIAGELCHQTEIPLHIISIPKVGSPRKITTWFWPLWGVLDDYPDITAFSKIGFVVPDPDYFSRVIKSGAFHEAGVSFLRVNVEGGGFLKDPDAVQTDFFGEEVNDNNLACPTYRGRNYQGLLEKGKKAIDLGVYEHIFDPERSRGKTICFCPRCLEQFKQYFSTVRTTLPYKSPKEFMPYWDKFPEYHALWTKFKVEKESERYADYKEVMLRHMKEKGLDQKRFKMLFCACGTFRPLSETATKEEKENVWYFGPVETTLEDPLILKDIFDYFCPMIYVEYMTRQADMLRISAELQGLYQYSGGKVKVYPVLSVGYPYISGNIEPNGMMKCQILEAFAGGAKGVVIYSEGWFDALDMKYFAEAMKQIIQVEDIVMEGKPIGEGKIKDLNNATFVKGITSEKGTIILVSEYSPLFKEARVEYKVDKACKVVDLSTMKEIARITPAGSTFNVTLDTDRARLFYLEKER